MLPLLCNPGKPSGSSSKRGVWAVCFLCAKVTNSGLGLSPICSPKHCQDFDSKC